MADLQPCPFCGGEADMVQPGTRRQSCIVECCNCGCRLESSDEGKRSGLAWNSRDGAAGVQPSDKALEWTPIDEVPQERAIFDSDVQFVGDVRLAIAIALRSSAFASPGGSFAAQMRIMANEVAKLELPAGVSASDDEPGSAAMHTTPAPKQE